MLRSLVVTCEATGATGRAPGKDCCFPRPTIGWPHASAFTRMTHARVLAALAAAPRGGCGVVRACSGGRLKLFWGRQLLSSEGELRALLVGKKLSIKMLREALATALSIDAALLKAKARRAAAAPARPM